MTIDFHFLGRQRLRLVACLSAFVFDPLVWVVLAAGGEEMLNTTSDSRQKRKRVTRDERTSF